MDSAFARSGGIAAGRKRVITLVNLSDVFEKEGKRSDISGNGTLSIVSAVA